MAAATDLPTTAPVLVAVLVAGAVLFAAGWLPARRLLGHHRWPMVVAASPVLGTGSLVLWNQTLQVLGLQVGAASLAVWLAATAAVSLLVPRPGLSTPTSAVPRWVGPALGAIVVGTAALWVSVVTGPRLTPDQTDSTRHAFFVARIMATGSNDPAEVLVEDPRTQEHSADYYPLTLHTTAATIAEATGLAVPAVLNGLVITYMTTVLVPGLVVLTRRLGGTWGAASAAGLAGSAVLPFPSVLYTWGFLPMIAALTVVPTAAVLADDWLGSGRRRALAAAVLGLVAVYGLHNTEVIVALMLVAGLGLGAASIGVETLGRRRRRPVPPSDALGRCWHGWHGWRSGVPRRSVPTWCASFREPGNGWTPARCGPSPSWTCWRDW